MNVDLSTEISALTNVDMVVVTIVEDGRILREWRLWPSEAAVLARELTDAVAGARR
jgi:hypothetical protein